MQYLGRHLRSDDDLVGIYTEEYKIAMFDAQSGA